MNLAHKNGAKAYFFQSLASFSNELEAFYNIFYSIVSQPVKSKYPAIHLCYFDTKGWLHLWNLIDALRAWTIFIFRILCSSARNFAIFHFISAFFPIKSVCTVNSWILFGIIIWISVSSSFFYEVHLCLFQAYFAGKCLIYSGIFLRLVLF